MSALVLACLAAIADGGAPVEVSGTYPNDRVMWDDLLSKAEPFELDGPVIAAVAPHHLIDGFELAGFWRALAQQQPPVVVLLAPDHYLRGPGVVGAKGVRWKTVFGDLEADPALTDALGIATGDQLFVGEHAVHVHAPFIRKLFPQARFVPVLLRWETPRAELEQLSERLARFPEGTLVVASVDFSHYQPQAWASFHDDAAHASVTSFEVDGLFEREVDSPEALFVALRTAQRWGGTRTVRVLHTNSQRRREGLVMDSTSHQYFITTPGPPAPVAAITVAITGAVPPDAGLGVVGPWRWSPTRDAGMPAHPGLPALRGQEDRFFMGADATLFELAPGARVERVVRGQRLVLVGVDLSDPMVPTFEGDCVVVVAHRGRLRGPDAEARAQQLLFRGAHAVVGRGFGAERPVAFLDGGVFAPSLGTLLGGAGRSAVLGLTCGSMVRAQVVPVSTTRDGVPRLDRARLEAERSER